MNKSLAALMTPMLFAAIVPVTGFGADAMQTRLCNLQGREVALRLSEELDVGLDTEQRAQAAQIAEAVCLEYSDSTANPTNNGLSVIERPEATATRVENVSPAEGFAAQPDTESGTDADTEEDKNGLFGNLKIIPAEDRVRRPGLKRR